MANEVGLSTTGVPASSQCISNPVSNANSATTALQSQSQPANNSEIAALSSDLYNQELSMGMFGQANGLFGSAFGDPFSSNGFGGDLSGLISDILSYLGVNNSSGIFGGAFGNPFSNDSSNLISSLASSGKLGQFLEMLGSMISGNGMFNNPLGNTLDPTLSDPFIDPLGNGLDSGSLLDSSSAGVDPSISDSFS